MYLHITSIQERLEYQTVTGLLQHTLHSHIMYNPLLKKKYSDNSQVLTVRPCIPFTFRIITPNRTWPSSKETTKIVYLTLNYCIIMAQSTSGICSCSNVGCSFPILLIHWLIFIQHYSLLSCKTHCALRSLVALIRVTVALLPCLKVNQSGVLTALIGCDMADAMQKKKLLQFWCTVQPYTSLQCYSKPRSCSLVSYCMLRYLGISIIDQTLTWITGSLMCICDLFACTHTYTQRNLVYTLQSHPNVHMWSFCTHAHAERNLV